jgi:hypothetical protein
VVKLEFIGANSDIRPVGQEKIEAVISYFKGKHEAWKEGIPTHSKVVYASLWPGIDLVYSGMSNKLKYEFVVHPGADPSKIGLAYCVARRVRVNKEGRLEVETPLGGFQDDRPEAYQESEGKRFEIGIGYEVKEGDGRNTYRFRVGEYDSSLPLILDPALLLYCGYIGGSSTDSSYGVAVDGSGNAYITGNTWSTEGSFPVKVGPDLTHNGNYDAFVAKISSERDGYVGT